MGGGPGAAGEGDAGGLRLLVVVLPAAAGDQPGLGVGEPGSWEGREAAPGRPVRAQHLHLPAHQAAGLPARHQDAWRSAEIVKTWTWPPALPTSSLLGRREFADAVAYNETFNNKLIIFVEYSDIKYLLSKSRR